MENNLDQILRDEGITTGDLAAQSGIREIDILMMIPTGNPTERQIRRIVRALKSLTGRKYSRAIVFPNN